MKRQRMKYLIGFIVLLCIEFLIAMYVHDTFIRPYVGDLLVVIVLYFMVRVIIPEKNRLMPLWIFIFASFIECLQYLKLLEILGMENNSVLKIILGATFDWKDIICYGIGCILIASCEWIAAKRQS